MISDVAPLSGTSSLRHLDLADNQVTDIAPLASLRRLEMLSVYKNTGITTLAPLAQLTALRELNVSFLKPEALAPEHLAPLTLLKNLRVQGGVMTTAVWASLSRFTLLEQLTAGMNPSISDLAPVAALPKLEYLDVHACSVRDLRPLVGLRSLRKVVLNYNQISDLAPLAGCPRLVSLYCFANPLTSAEAVAATLRRLPALQTLTLPKERFGPEQQRLLRASVPPSCRVRFL